jgi:hypothetical protein
VSSQYWRLRLPAPEDFSQNRPRAVSQRLNSAVSAPLGGDSENLDALGRPLEVADESGDQRFGLAEGNKVTAGERFGRKAQPLLG